MFHINWQIEKVLIFASDRLTIETTCLTSKNALKNVRNPSGFLVVGMVIVYWSFVALAALLLTSFSWNEIIFLYILNICLVQYWVKWFKSMIKVVILYYCKKINLKMICYIFDQEKVLFSNFSCMFLKPNVFSNLNSNCSNLLDMKGIPGTS